MRDGVKVVANCLFVAVASIAVFQADAVAIGAAYAAIGARPDGALKKLEPVSLPGNPSVVGTVDFDADGNVVVNWTDANFPIESIAPKAYAADKDFVKEYVDKCEARADKSRDNKVLGAAALRKSDFNKAGRKIWALHLEAVKAVQAAAESAKAEEKMARQKLLAGTPLESLFGVKLGKPINTASYEMAANGKAYVFAPAKRFRSFDRYTFRSSPTSKIVYQIQAVSSVTAATDEDDDWGFTRKALMMRFKKLEAQEDPDGNGYSLLFPGADGNVGRKIIVRRTELGMSITAVDTELKKKAEEEQLAIDAAEAL